MCEKIVKSSWNKEDDVSWKANSIFDCASHMIVVAVFALTFITMVFFLMRGLDITDEGYYLLSARYPQDDQAVITFAFFLTNIIFKASGYNVFLFRLLGLGLLVTSGLLVGLAISRVISRLMGRSITLLMKVSFASFCGLGALVYYIWGILTPGYNLLISFVVNLTLVFVAFIYSELLVDRRDWARGSAIFFCQGVFVCIAMMAKFSSGAVLLMLSSLWIIFSGLIKKDFVRSAGAFVAGIFLFLAVFFLFVKGVPFDLSHYIHQTSNALKISGHLHHNYLREYCTGIIFGTIATIREAALIYLGYIILSYYLLKKCFRYGLFYHCLSLVLFASTGLLFVNNGGILGGYQHLFAAYVFYLFWLIFLGIAILINLKRFEELDFIAKQPAKHALLAGGFFIFSMLSLPYIGALGTVNPIFFNVLFSITPWFGIFLIFICMLSALPWNRSWRTIIPILISLAAAIQVVSAPIIDPYGWSVGLLQQTEPVLIGEPKSKVYVDKGTKLFFENIRHIADQSGFHAGNDVLAFTDMPGVVFALGGRSPGTAWWVGRYAVPEYHKQYNEYVLSLLPKAKIRCAFILEQIDGLGVVPDLKHYQINFPGAYVLSGEAYWPALNARVRLWRPRLLDVTGSQEACQQSEADL